MRTNKARHPWHPIFVHFPIALWVIAFFTEVLSRAFPQMMLPGDIAPGAFSMLLLWAGNIAALAAMVAGMVDMAALPEKVMPTLYRHMSWMLMAWVLMLIAGLLRTLVQGWTTPPGWLSLSIEFSAIVCLTAGGLQASRLVYHLHLGEQSTELGCHKDSDVRV